MDSDVNILEEMEMSAVEQGLTRSSQQRRRRKRDEDSQAMEESYWMKELSVTMKANQALLEKLLEEKNQRTTDRDPFIQYISQILRTVPQEQYVALSEGIMELVRGKTDVPQLRGPDQAAAAHTQISSHLYTHSSSSSSTTNPGTKTTAAAGSMVVISHYSHYSHYSQYRLHAEPESLLTLWEGFWPPTLERSGTTLQQQGA